MLASWTLGKAYCKYALLQNTPGLAQAGTSPQATAKANSVYAGDLGYNCNELGFIYMIRFLGVLDSYQHIQNPNL